MHNGGHNRCFFAPLADNTFSRKTCTAVPVGSSGDVGTNAEVEVTEDRLVYMCDIWGVLSGPEGIRGNDHIRGGFWKGAKRL